jgi:hypothetical protein
MFFLTTLKKGVEFEMAADAAWKVTYVLFPVMSAFGTFWFLPKRTEPPGATPTDNALLAQGRCVAMFTITGAVNFIVLLFFTFGVVFPDFNDPRANYSYHERVDAGIRVMVFLATFFALPVGFVLGQQVETARHLPPPLKNPDEEANT